MIPKHPPQPHPAGQGLSEYALTGGLVVIVCIVSLAALGTNVSDMLGSTISKRNTTLAAAPTANTPNNLAGSQALANTPPDSAFGRTLTVQLPNGESQQFRIPDPRTIIDTDGTDGVTRAYLAQLDQVIQAIRQTLPANDPRIAALERLSLKGHEVAETQRNAERLNNAGQYADVSPLTFMTDGRVTENLDFKNLDQCSSFLGARAGAYAIDQNPSQCTPSLSNSRKTLITDDQRSLLQNFAVMAADIRRDLTDQQKSGLLPLYDYFAGNIIQSGIATQKSVIGDPVVIMPTKGKERAIAQTPQSTEFIANRSNNFKSAFIEVQANGLCGMSGFETCQRQNGQTVQKNPSLNPDSATSAGVAASDSN